MTDQNPDQPQQPNPYPGQPANPGQPAYQGQQPYSGQQQPYAGQNGAVPGRRNTLALVSLILGILGFFTGITAIGAIVTGHISLSQIKKTGEEGRGMALTGTILGYVAVVLGIIAAIALGAFLAAVANNPELYNSTY